MGWPRMSVSGTQAMGDASGPVPVIGIGLPRVRRAVATPIASGPRLPKI
ncbi:hypothetical protein XOCgx_3415 [Xanthomonas oryzae pv. oryzicola]|nr:hypothetical protein XOCgx_3415 [Xanthomonas oryzae pv. oryzicola]